jgi:hypothetical protein
VLGHRAGGRAGVARVDGGQDPLVVGLQERGVTEPLHRLHRVAPHRVPQRAHDGGDQPVARGVRDGAVEGRVVLHELLGRVRRAHRGQGGGQGRGVGAGCRRPVGGPALDHQPGVDDLAQLQARHAQMQSEQVGERAVRPGGEDGARLGPPPHLRGHHAEGLQHAHRLAYGGAADAELLGELPLGRQPGAHREAVLDDAALDLGEHVLERARLLGRAAGDGQRGLLGRMRSGSGMV